MLWLARLFVRLIEIAVWAPVRALRFLVGSVAFNPRLGWIRYVFIGAFGYVLFALALVYVAAPIRGYVGAYFMADKLRYDSERWLATAIYDSRGSFIGTFDPRLDSRQDFNWTDKPIEIGDYVANPDHKSIPVREVPDQYWQCLLFHEDRYLGGPLNPFGIDLLGVLKIPYSSIRRTIAKRRPSLGVGGSTLPMQFARVIYKTPPHADEGGLTKLSRKVREWWLAPVIYRELTRGGDFTPLKRWAANHIWLAQRTGGPPLQGVELTSRIVFGKEAKELSTAEQFVLASAVNKPIILLPGNDRLNEVRLDHWRYITEVRARTCAERLIKDQDEQRKVVFELVQMASGPPDARIKPRLQQALDQYAPAVAQRASANPVARANALMPTTRFGLREEIKQTFGFNWRTYARGVTTSFDVVENLAFRERLKAKIGALSPALQPRINPGFVLDQDAARDGTKAPSVVVVAANHKGEIVRYYESGQNAPYYGSALAKDATTGFYDPARESLAIASTGKIMAAIAIANEGRDDADTLYLDTQAPDKGLETCDKSGTGRHGRRAIVAFACSLNNPLINRTAQVGQDRIRTIISGFGFAPPPANGLGEPTPPSTSVVLGLVNGSPRRVHHMSSVMLAAMLGQARPVRAPSLIQSWDYTDRTMAEAARRVEAPIPPRQLIRREAVSLLRTLLSAPLCYTANGTAHGTMKSLGQWCASRRGDLRLHFGKTGTSTTTDPNATVDTWATGGLQFANGAAYSYVVMVGTGSTSEPWARSLHAAQVATPLLEVLLEDLAGHAKTHAEPSLLPPRPVTAAQPVAEVPDAAPRGKTARLQTNGAERDRVFNRN
jgi:membrane peptidoglycan carboxypeptidase